MDGIIDFAKGHDASMIVIGTHSRGIIGKIFLGSVANAVIGHSPIPVLVVPPESKE